MNDPWTIGWTTRFVNGRHLAPENRNGANQWPVPNRSWSDPLDHSSPRVAGQRPIRPKPMGRERAHLLTIPPPGPVLRQHGPRRHTIRPMPPPSHAPVPRRSQQHPHHAASRPARSIGDRAGMTVLCYCHSTITPITTRPFADDCTSPSIVPNDCGPPPASSVNRSPRATNGSFSGTATSSTEWLDAGMKTAL